MKTFMVGIAGAILAATGKVFGADAKGGASPEKAVLANPTAMALKYVEKSTVTGSSCLNCSLYLGKPNEPRGSCTMFQGVTVNANGWCSAYQKKKA